METSYAMLVKQGKHFLLDAAWVSGPVKHSQCFIRFLVKIRKYNVKKKLQKRNADFQNYFKGVIKKCDCTVRWRVVFCSWLPKENWQKLELLLYLCAFSFLQASLFSFNFIFCYVFLTGSWNRRSDGGFNQFHWDFSASGSVRWILSSVKLSWPFHHPRGDYFDLLPFWQPKK